MITLYLAEDQSLLNTALAQLLGLEDDLQVVGTATDGQTALTEILALQPAVVILDIEMPQLTGLDVADALKQQHYAGKVMILTTFAQKTYFERAVQADVAGYLLKDSPSDQLITAIRRVVAGQTLYAPELVVNMLSSEQNPLSKRETEVLQVAAQGGTTKAIAAQLFLSDGTVRNYLSAVFSKLGVHSRLAAVQVAKAHQWL
ncbi:response regulator transcription factor [Loigolactobacillus bifermentans]|jgi:two-component system response regulator DesR|uniref:Response regulator n=1 Tax=Loigolactobacillus bifermentans DSM 20003 TaxID=1423726 RepID=A0A0R1H1Q2_9LACO|nr:response regulator transcription factor [Loigolactobacillus bifermentans]KRK40507.1 response regulator [Loigolactobacillus bifermentans DSM 20003]QGG61191.1 response regulator [Loigolactobacillus bifermentans]